MNKIFASGVLILFFGCVSEQIDIPPDYGGYPPEIASIMIERCATAGCHTQKSKVATAGLSLESYSDLFEGSLNNAAVIPYCSDQSFMMFFINSYQELGPTITPLMPYNGEKLTKEDVLLVKTWIDNGAPDIDGNVMFSGSTSRKKVYIANQGCDLVAVFDTETNLMMRCVAVGASEAIEVPHMIKMSADGKYWYVVYTAGEYLQKYDVATDQLIAQCNLSFGEWNTFALTSDGKTGFAVEWKQDGRIAVVDLESMTLLETYQGSGLLVQSHGSMVSPDDNFLYVTAQSGNYIYKIDITDVYNPGFEEIVLATGQSPSAISSYDPHELIFNPDGSQYFVTCQNTDEIRVFDAATDAFVKAIGVGEYPQELAISTSTDYLFISCSEDKINFPGKIGSVSVVNYKTLEFVKHIYTGYQPHGLAIDESNKKVYVANRNVNAEGPAPHHTTECGGRNGYLTLIDMNTLTLDPSMRAEVSVDPYAISISK